MNLSRAAKKFRAQTPNQPAAPKPARANTPKAAPPPAPPPAPQPAETAEPVAAVPAAEPTPAARPKRAKPAKAKRPRFVRGKAERRERVSPPELPRGTTAAARVMTRNLALPPKDDRTQAGR